MKIARISNDEHSKNSIEHFRNIISAKNSCPVEKKNILLNEVRHVGTNCHYSLSAKGFER